MPVNAKKSMIEQEFFGDQPEDVELPTEDREELSQQDYPEDNLIPSRDASGAIGGGRASGNEEQDEERRQLSQGKEKRQSLEKTEEANTEEKQNRIDLIKQAYTTMVTKGKKLIAKGGTALAKTKAVMGENFDRLPTKIKEPVAALANAAYATGALAKEVAEPLVRAGKIGSKVWWSGFIAGNKAVQAIAQEKGATREEATRLSKAVTAVDFALGGSRSGGLTALLGFPAAAPLVGMMPIGSLSYLALNTATNPLVVLQAARRAVSRVARRLTRKSRPKVKLAKQFNLDTNAVKRIYDGLKKFGHSYEACLYAALDVANDENEALDIADAATRTMVKPKRFERRENIEEPEEPELKTEEQVEEPREPEETSQSDEAPIPDYLQKEKGDYPYEKDFQRNESENILQEAINAEYRNLSPEQKSKLQKTIAGMGAESDPNLMDKIRSQKEF